MSRETKKERIVSKIIDPITEHLHELKAIIANPNTKESDLEHWVQSVIKSCLGYSAIDGYLVSAQEAKGKMRPDLVVQKNDVPLFVVEVKKPTFDFHKSDFRSGKTQLAEYIKQMGNLRWGLLSNGYEWKLYDFSNPNNGLEIISFDIRGEDDTIDLSKKAVEELCWSFLDLHEVSYSSKEWESFSKEAIAFSPESLAKAILSFDSIKYISKAIRGEHDYRANMEVLFDKIHDLVVNGLDDSVAGWNEEKHSEIKKYVHNQKRLSRKKKNVKEVVAKEKSVTPILNNENKEESNQNNQDQITDECKQNKAA